jgi:exo-beta-1,3-glucanase (GH17 family)/cellulose synthase/poly-beta-1,6-N-acetylglucosamine synthase-like glycosyltransferase
LRCSSENNNFKAFKEMNKSNFIIVMAVAIMVVSLWSFANRPEQEPAWPRRIQGFSFSPMRAGQSPVVKTYPTEAEIDADLALLAGKTHAIRTYTVEDVLAKIPELASKHGLNVALGMWIDANSEKNEQDFQTLLKIARSHSNVVRVIIGNEAILRDEISVHELAGYLDRARKALRVPVSTAEPWHVWLKNPELAEHVDYLAVHMLPYWEGIHVDLAVTYIVDRLNELKFRFPKKPIVIAEVGWPSNGRTRKGAEASLSNQASFLRRFLELASREKYTYYIMEAFDQPWKRQTEGAVGAYWGVYDLDRQPKFPFTEPIVAIPEWRILAGLSVVIAVITMIVLLIDSRTLGSRGRSFLAVLAFSAASAAVWIVDDYLNQYLTAQTILVGILMLLGMTGVIVVILTEGHEWAEARWTTAWRRPFRPVQDEFRLPVVSIHVPTFNEPPQMVIETLNALARLDYPDYEVVVMDNNTRDPDTWQPVEAHCRALGERFRFLHVEELAGFKAGALNFALKHTSSRAEIIAVIDSDYIVDAAWLKDLAPQFMNTAIAIVQAPQDYRDDGVNAFKAMCYEEYRGFFFIGMITRNERNAIIQHGTMTMIRRAVLEEVGGWGEWCITEDAELGLRIFARGYEALYVSKSYGKGLMPDTYSDYKKQRFRWAYGAVQILRRNCGELLAHRPSRLTHGQRYHFFAGWLPWIADSTNLLFTIAALIWSLAMLIAPRKIDPPQVIFSVFPLALFSFKVGKMIYLYHTQVRATITQTFAAAFAGLSLSHTIARAVLLGFVTKNRPFFRTPKMAGSHPMVRALAAAREELLLLTALLLAAAGIALLPWSAVVDLYLWVIVLLVQAIPYSSALLMSLISAFPRLSAGFIGHAGGRGRSPIKAIKAA